MAICIHTYLYIASLSDSIVEVNNIRKVVLMNNNTHYAIK